MKLFRVLPIAIFLGLFCVNAQAYEADVDPAWIASKNGGSTELNDGNDDENPDCIGDGCGEQAKSAPAKSAEATRKSWEKEDAKGPADEDECTPADSLLPECQEETVASDDDDDDDDTYERYTNENADISRASREGFSSGFTLGFRFGGGFNMFFLGEEIEDWRIGYEATAGLITQAKLGNAGLFATVGLSFSYFRYRYEADLEYDFYSEEDEGIINLAQFEIPMILKYAIGGGNIAVGLGFDLGLKLTGSSTFDQTINTSAGPEHETHDNTLPTAGVELGGIFEISYNVNRNFVIDLRAVQRITNLLNHDVVFETSVKNAKLYGLHGTIGFSLFL